MSYLTWLYQVNSEYKRGHTAVLTLMLKLTKLCQSDIMIKQHGFVRITQLFGIVLLMCQKANWVKTYTR